MVCGREGVVHTGADNHACDGQRMQCTAVVEVSTQELPAEHTALVLRAYHHPLAPVFPQHQRGAAPLLRTVDGLVLEVLLCAHGCDIIYIVAM